MTFSTAMDLLTACACVAGASFVGLISVYLPAPMKSARREDEYENQDFEY